MRIKTLFFASIREIVGCREAEIELPEGSSIKMFKGYLTARYPALSGLQQSISVAVNAEYADEDRVLQPGDEVALIPPVSGG